MKKSVDLLLDIRNQDEIDTVKYNNDNGDFATILYMPANVIKYNLVFLHEYFEKYDTVYIICKSGNRSHKIKDTYFADDEKVSTNITHFNTMSDEQVIRSSGLHMSLTRKIQIISGSIILLLLLLSLVYDDAKYMFFIFGSLMLYVGISGNCFMSSILTSGDI
jgi:hypothetical protein